MLQCTTAYPAAVQVFHSSQCHIVRTFKISFMFSLRCNVSNRLDNFCICNNTAISFSKNVKSLLRAESIPSTSFSHFLFSSEKEIW